MLISVKCLWSCMMLLVSLQIFLFLKPLILAVNTIFESNTGLDLKLSKIKLRELFYFATSHTHFLFNGCFYDQVDGAAMGSPLAPM